MTTMKAPCGHPIKNMSGTCGDLECSPCYPSNFARERRLTIEAFMTWAVREAGAHVVNEMGDVMSAAQLSALAAEYIRRTG